MTVDFPYFGDPKYLHGRPFDSTAEWHIDSNGERQWVGPVYPKLPQLDKFRRLARDGIATMPEEEAEAYGIAVGKAFRSLNGCTKRAAISLGCTAETDAKCRARIRAAFEEGIRLDRARVTDDDIKTEYAKQMKAKRRREAKRAAMIEAAAVRAFAELEG